MEIGIGLPVAIPAARGADILDWAVAAEARGFSALTTIDRLLYPSYESLLSLAAAAAVTTRISLMTAALIAPSRPNTTLLAKEALTLDALCDGRLTLALAVGSRADDFDAAGARFAGRGRFLDSQLERLDTIWSERDTARPVSPAGPRKRPDVLIGGHSRASLARAARYGRGWLAGGERHETLDSMTSQLRDAWRAAGRHGQPEVHAADFFALGPDARATADTYIRDFFAFLPDGGAKLAGSIPTTIDEVRALRDSYRSAGVTQLIWNPCSADPTQLEMLADAVL